jgi:chemotaxis signal transduction protein
MATRSKSARWNLNVKIERPFNFQLRSSLTQVEYNHRSMGLSPTPVVGSVNQTSLKPVHNFLGHEHYYVVSASEMMSQPELHERSRQCIFGLSFERAHVVRRNVQELGGRISLKSTAGKGMTIQLVLPLTLAVMDGMFVTVSAETYVMPISSIVECIRPAATEFQSLFGARAALRLRGTIIPLVYLGDLFDLPTLREHTDESTVIIIETSEGARLGVVVDQLCGHQQVVIKSIEENYGSVMGIAGATILGDGHVAFILDAERLGEFAKSPECAPTQRAPAKT